MGVSTDEVLLNCKDDYESLPYKTKAMLEWFLNCTTEQFIFLCDNDTYVNYRKLSELPYAKYDYSGKSSLWPPNSKLGVTFQYKDGRGNTIENCHPWASGGYGYFLSRKAAEIIVTSGEPTSWAEDLWVGQVLGPRMDILKYDYPEYHNNVTWHWWKPVGGKITPYELLEVYRNGGVPQGKKWYMR
ncbi:Galactosyltransferase [uncultured archaeon]|nr:Galactosyltransferase [uncultured archaeon]